MKAPALFIFSLLILFLPQKVFADSYVQAPLEYSHYFYCGEGECSHLFSYNNKWNSFVSEVKPALTRQLNTNSSFESNNPTTGIYLIALNTDDEVDSGTFLILTKSAELISEVNSLEAAQEQATDIKANLQEQGGQRQIESLNSGIQVIFYFGAPLIVFTVGWIISKFFKGRKWLAWVIGCLYMVPAIVYIVFILRIVQNYGFDVLSLQGSMLLILLLIVTIILMIFQIRSASK